MTRPMVGFLRPPPRGLPTGFTRVGGVMRFCVDYVPATIYSLLIPPHATESWEDALWLQIPRYPVNC